jgi:hypothetical protein
MVLARRRQRAVFLLNTREVAEAKSIMESLSLAKENMLDHEYVPVGPLMATHPGLSSIPWGRLCGRLGAGRNI